MLPLEPGNNGKKQGENMDNTPWFRDFDMSNPELWVDAQAWRLEQRLTTIRQSEASTSVPNWVTQNLSL